MSDPWTCISFLNFHSQTFERTIYIYGLHFFTLSSSHNSFLISHSWLDSCHVTKMALNEVFNDLYIATSIGHFKTLIIFDLSVAVGSVSHSLFFRKALSSWLHDSILSWFSSYPSGQFLLPSFVSFSSSIQLLNWGISQSPVLIFLLLSIQPPWETTSAPTILVIIYRLMTPESVPPDSFLGSLTNAPQCLLDICTWISLRHF